MIVVITLAVAIMHGVARAQAIPKQSTINHIFVLLNVVSLFKNLNFKYYIFD